MAQYLLGVLYGSDANKSNLYLCLHNRRPRILPRTVHPVTPQPLSRNQTTHSICTIDAVSMSYHICISFQLHCFQLPFHLCILLTGFKLKLYSNSSNTHEVYIIAQIITTPPYNIYICTSFCINPIALPFFAYLSL